MTYMTIDQIKEDNEMWFSPATMSFFDSQITPGVWPVEGGAYFVTSEQQPHPYQGDERTARYWTVRFAADGGHDIRSVGGGFMAHPTLGDALDMAYELAGRPGPHPHEYRVANNPQHPLTPLNPHTR